MQFHTIFDSNKRRYAIKVRADGHVSFRDLTSSSTGVRVTPTQEEVLNKLVGKILPLINGVAIPADAAGRSAKAAPEKEAKSASGRKPGRPAKAASKAAPKAAPKAAAKKPGRKKAS